MLVFDLTLATRSKNLTGVERFGLNLFAAWSKESPSAVALVCDEKTIAPDTVRASKLPPLLAWFLAPFLVPRSTKAILFPSFPPSPLFLLTSHALFRIIHDTVPWDHAATMPLRGRLMFRDLENLFLFRYRKVFCPTFVAADGLHARFPGLETVICGNSTGIDVDSSAMAPPTTSFPAGKFLLSVGTVEPRKNYEHLLKLFEGASPPDLGLVIVGRDGWGEVGKSISRQAAANKKILWLRSVEDSELRWLYARCAAFVTLSLAEGFNMPLVEAGCFGRPALASNLAIHHKMAPPWTAYLDLPSGTQDFQEGLNTVFKSDPPPAEVSRYREQFSWARIASCIRDALPSPYDTRR